MNYHSLKYIIEYMLFQNIFIRFSSSLVTGALDQPQTALETPIFLNDYMEKRPFLIKYEALLKKLYS